VDFRETSIFVENNGFWRVVASLAMSHAKYLVIYWYFKGHKAETINDKLKDYFGATAPPYSTVTYRCRKLKHKYDVLLTRRGPGRPLEVDLDDAILDAVNEFPSHNLRSLSRVLKRLLSTIRDHFIRGRLIVKHLKWVPHMLTAKPKEQRAQLAKGLLKTTAATCRDSWSHFTTGDKSWFDLSTDYEAVWLQEGEERPIREKKVIWAGKVILTIFWSPKAIHLIDAFPKGGRLPSNYFGQNILSGLHVNLPPTGTVRPILIHMDNASPHRSKETFTGMNEFNFRPVLHLLFSPDSSPSDFYLFGTIKGRLRGRTF
jgi:hypothetical protein